MKPAEVLVIGLLPGLVACGPAHVALSAPAPSAPPADRIASYQQLRPHSAMAASSGLEGGIPDSVLRTSDRLQLAGGAQVYQPEDLLPVVPRESRAAVAAQRADAADARAAWLTIGAVGLLVTGAAILATPFVTTSGNESVNLEPVYIGTGVAVLSVPVFLFGGAERRRATRERANAFEAYEPALLRRLDLCPTGGGATPCH